MGRSKNDIVIAEISYRDKPVCSLTFGGNSPLHRRLVNAIISGDTAEADRLVRRRCPDRSIFPSAGRLSSDWLIVCRIEP